MKYFLLSFIILLSVITNSYSCNPTLPVSGSGSSQPAVLPVSQVVTGLPVGIVWSDAAKTAAVVGSAMIKGNKDKWLKNLRLDKKNKNIAIVNASNPSIKNVGGGLDGALANWAKKNGVTPWTNPVPQMSGGGAAPNILAAGQYAYFAGTFGTMYLAVGPQASDVNTLQLSAELVKNLYASILTHAKSLNMEHVVLPAISTNIFAYDGRENSTGKQFTKEEYISHMYRGMHQGIEEFCKKNSGAPMRIILNNWDARITTGLNKV